MVSGRQILQVTVQGVAVGGILPWVLVGIICVILAIALVMMARKGDI